MPGGLGMKFRYTLLSAILMTAVVTAFVIIPVAADHRPRENNGSYVVPSAPVGFGNPSKMTCGDEIFPGNNVTSVREQSGICVGGYVFYMDANATEYAEVTINDEANNNVGGLIEFFYFMNHSGGSGHHPHFISSTRFCGSTNVSVPDNAEEMRVHVDGPVAAQLDNNCGADAFGTTGNITVDWTE